MKILLATFWEVPHVGGVWNYMQQLKQELEGLGHEVDLLGHGLGNKSVHIVNKNIPWLFVFAVLLKIVLL